MWAWSVGTLQGTGEFTGATKIPSRPAIAAPMIDFAGRQQTCGDAMLLVAGMSGRW